MPKLYNKHHGDAPPDAIYIGRGSDFGNPFVIDKDGDRATVIAKFEERLRNHPQRDAMVQTVRERLGGKDLVCFCAPKPCHGDILMRIANSTGDPWAEAPARYSDILSDGGMDPRTEYEAARAARAKPFNKNVRDAIPTALDTLDDEIAYLASSLVTTTPNLKLRFQKKLDDLKRVREWLASKHAHVSGDDHE